MRRVVPDHLDLPLEDLYTGLTLDGDRPGEQRWLAVGMVSAVDGAASVAERTADLGGEADRVAFQRLRETCDAILVGAGTVRTEGYGPPTGTPQRRTRRRRRGLSAVPRLVVVSGRAALASDHRIFGDPRHRPIVATTLGADDRDVARLRETADVVRLGDDAVDLPGLLDHLASLGLRRVLCEGGPTLNGFLVAADLVDEWFVTITPAAIGGAAPRIAAGHGTGVPRPLALTSVHEHEGELLLRYTRGDRGA